MRNDSPCISGKFNCQKILPRVLLKNSFYFTLNFLAIFAVNGKSMKELPYLLYLLLLTCCLISCRINRPAIVPSAGNSVAQNYIERYKDLAVSEMKRSGIPASIILAQGMIESDYGRSTLAREANNHFGIKCHNDWKGPVVRHHDETRNECFRKYSRPEDSFIDHSDFLKSGSRYSFLFALPVTDYKGWAKGLKKAGYATNPDYANMLIKKIEENNLDYLDRLYAAAPSKPEVQSFEHQAIKSGISKINEESADMKPDAKDKMTDMPALADNFTIRLNPSRILENNRLQYIIIRDGETLEMIEKEFQVFRWELQRFNDFDDDFSLLAGQILYLQPKRDKAEKGKEKHTAVAGDTMHSISQKYGVKLKRLYEYNRMAEGEEATEGQVIWLRQTKPSN